MAIALRAAGTATAATVGVTAMAPAVPTGATTGDLSVLTVWMKPYNATITTPSGWTKIGEHTNGTTAAGTDTGSTKVAVYVRESAAVGAIPAIGTATGNSAGAVINTYSKGATEAWDYSAFVTGSDATNAANYSATGATGLGTGVAAGDWVLASTAVCGDVGTVSAQAIAGMAGATLGTVVNRQNSATTTGTDSRGLVSDVPVSAGSSTAAPTFTYTNASSTSGTTIWLRLRVYTPTAVSRAYSTSWNVAQQVPKAYSTSWNAAGIISRAYSTSWNNLSVISKAYSTSWNANSIIAKSASTTWNVLIPIGREYSTLWNVLSNINPVSRAYSTSWNVNKTVSRANSTSWIVRSIVVVPRSTLWNVRFAVSKATSTSWNVRAIVTAPRSTLWNVVGRVSSSRSTLWNVRVTVTSSRSTSWHTYTIVAKPFSTLWNVIEATTPIGRAYATSWNVRKTVTAPRSTLWNVRAKVTVPLGTSWNVNKLIAKALSTTWNVRGLITKPYSTLWNTRDGQWMLWNGTSLEDLRLEGVWNGASVDPLIPWSGETY